MPASKAQTFVNEIEMRLQSLKREFLDLELTQMRKGEVSARQKIERAKKSIGTKRRELEQRLSRAKEDPEAASDEARQEIEAAWAELRGAVDQAREDFQEEESRA